MATSFSFVPGDRSLVRLDSPAGGFAAVFEDDGESGYLYPSLAGTGSALSIIGALMIYDIRQLENPQRRRTGSLAWSSNGLVAGMFVDGVCLGVFDFESRRGGCRTGFPPSVDVWTRLDWRDPQIAKLLELLTR